MTNLLTFHIVKSCGCYKIYMYLPQNVFPACVKMHFKVVTIGHWSYGAFIPVMCESRAFWAGFGFGSRFEISDSDHTPIIFRYSVQMAFYDQLDSNPDSDSKQLDSDLGSRKKR